MSEIFAEQLTAVANVALAIFAIVTAVLAGLAFRKQSREVSDQAEMLELQRQQLVEQQKASAAQAGVLALQVDELRESLEERRREARRKHRTQAVLVFISEQRYEVRGDSGIGTRPPDITATLVNSSDQPVYDISFYWWLGNDGHGDPNPEPLGHLLPGATVTRARRFPTTDPEAAGVSARFTDAAGTRWVRRPDGLLREEAMGLFPMAYQELSAEQAT